MAPSDWCISVPSYGSKERLCYMIESWHKHMPDIDFCLYGQGYTMGDYEQFADCCEWNERFRFKAVGTYPTPICLISIRDDARESMCSTYEYVLWADDDFVFKPKSLLAYERAVQYLKEHEQCGAVQCSGVQGIRKGTQGQINILVGQRYLWTSRGILLRNLERMYVGPPVSWFGYEDTVPCAFCYSLGYYYAELRGCSTHHRRHHPGNWTHPKGGLRQYLTQMLGMERKDMLNIYDASAQPVFEYWQNAVNWGFPIDGKPHKFPQSVIDLYMKRAIARFDTVAISCELRELGYTV